MFECNQHSWGNMGLINYAMESFPSALSAFRKAVQISLEINPDENGTSFLGRLVNNMACVNAEMGKIPLAQSEFEESLRIQKGSFPCASFDSNSSAEEGLLSISVAIFNIGVICAKQKQYQTAISHVEGSLTVRPFLRL